jgi:soluble lytic murein transglycosylase
MFKSGILTLTLLTATGPWTSVLADEGAVSQAAESAGAASQLDLEADNEPSNTDDTLTDSPNDEGAAAGPFLSFFISGPLADAKLALERRRPTEVLRLLAEIQSQPARYLKAQALIRMGRTVDGAQSLVDLATDWPELRDLCYFEGAETFERSHQLARAISAYLSVSASSRWFARAHLAAARLEKRRRHFPEAIDALLPLVGAANTHGRTVKLAEVWMGIADLARLQGDFNGEHRALLATWALFPGTSQANQAQSRLVGLPYPPKWKVARAETMLSRHFNLEAMELLERLLPALEGTDEVACRARFAFGAALRKERKHAKAIAILRPVVEGCTSEELLPRALYVLGYSESVVEPSMAIRTYELLSQRFPAHPHSDDALFYAGELKRRQGDLDGALRTFEAVAQRHPTGDFLGQALFAQFWTRRAKGEAAVNVLERLESLHAQGLVSEESALRARYWRGKALASTGQIKEAHAAWTHLVQEHGGTFYGLLARSRLEGTEPSPTTAAPVLPESPAPMISLEQSATLQTGLAMLRLGHREAAAELLEQGVRAPLAERRALSNLMSATGRQGTARLLLRGKDRTVASVGAPPRPLRKLIERYSRSAGISPDLMQALIREESAFNPNARSTTGALGLAQLMPQTASRVARNLGYELGSSSALLEPKENIRLGSAYLGELQRRFSGNLVYAVASYNAGPGAVSSWLKRLPDLELDAWVEEVPVEETRNYVKRVLGSYAAYHLKSGKTHKPELASVE